jgi:hypothetical protein
MGVLAPGSAHDGPSPCLGGRVKKMKNLLIKFLAISCDFKQFFVVEKKPLKTTHEGAGGLTQICSPPQILFCFRLKTPPKISEPYDNSFWEKSNARRKKEEENHYCKAII